MRLFEQSLILEIFSHVLMTVEAGELAVMCLNVLATLAISSTTNLFDWMPHVRLLSRHTI